MASLRKRLLLGIGALVLATGAAAGGVAFKSSFDEANELQDSELVQIGALAAARGAQPLAAVGKTVDADQQVTIEELGIRGGGSADTTSLASLPLSIADGLQTITRHGETWRIVVRTRADGSRVVVGQPTDIRDDAAAESAIRTVLPLAALVPCLMLLVAVVVNRTLRPFAHLAERLDGERSVDFEQLPMDNVPSELRPFIASINRLLARLRTMVEQQGRFIADAAHELRTPITALSVQAGNLDRMELPPESRERLLALAGGIRRIAHLLEQLLAMARYDTGLKADLPAANIESVAREVLAELLPLAAARGVDLGSVHLEPALVRAEPTALAVLMRNLVGNAIRHTPTSGRVDIDVRRDGQEIVLRVEDSGPGIDPGDLARVFEPFFRGSQATEGAGLGLSIVRRIVDGFGGTIDLHNKPPAEGTGLLVTVSIPQATVGSI